VKYFICGEAWKNPDAMVHHDSVALGVILRPLFGAVSLVLFFLLIIVGGNSEVN
jgi:hypothetical protein